MTNAEAIEHLKNITIFSYQDGYTTEAREALDMAIKALEAQELSNNSPKLDSEFGDLAEIDKAFELVQENARSDTIHCGECKYYHDSDGCFFSTATTGADGFCHWAERKEGEADEADY